MTVFHPAQVSEREPDGTYEDCTWATGVMLWNARSGANVVPSTRAEYEALRVAGGDGPAEKPGDGSNFNQLAMGMEARYGWRPPVRIPTFADAWRLFAPGTAMGWQGSMRNVGDYLRRWDVGFRGAHAVLAIRDDTKDRAWWMNPLAPRSFPGEYVTKAQLRAFYEGLPGAAITWSVVGKPPIPPDTSVPEEPVILYRVLEPLSGTVTVKGTGHQIVTPDDRRRDAPNGSVRECVAKIELLKPLDTNPGDRSTAYLVGRLLAPTVEPQNAEVAILLASAGEFKAKIIDCSAAIAADRATARIVYG